MTKELEALERIIETFYDKNTEDIEVVKTALKDYEMERTLRVRLENINYELVREKQENNKKLKALEIIKEKKINVGYLLVMIELFGDKALNEYNKSAHKKTEELTQEEFNLLKEWLKD